MEWNRSFIAESAAHHFQLRSVAVASLTPAFAKQSPSARNRPLSFTSLAASVVHQPIERRIRASGQKQNGQTRCGAIHFFNTFISAQKKAAKALGFYPPLPLLLLLRLCQEAAMGQHPSAPRPIGWRCPGGL